ncbi:MAG: hypothetical protein ACOY31_03205 [Bacillota bacterium]
MKKIAALLALTTIILLSVPGCLSKNNASPERNDGGAGVETPPVQTEMVREIVLNNIYVYKEYVDHLPNDMREQYFTVFMGDSAVYSGEKLPYTIATPYYVCYPPAPGQDITGDGTPDLVVACDSGGPQGYTNYFVMSLGREFGVTGVASNTGSFEFKDLNGDGIYELQGKDGSFLRWKADYYDSPAPAIVLTYKNGGYHLAADIMKHPVDEEDFDYHVRLVEREMQKLGYSGTRQRYSQNDWGIPPSLWGYMLDLIYSGNMNRAWDFLDRAWPEEKSGQDDFSRQFAEQLKTSPYWDEVSAMNEISSGGQNNDVTPQS